MTNTLAQLEQLMRSPGQRTHNGSSWHNWCAAWVCRAVSGVDSSGSGLGPSADTARQALAKSGHLTADPSKAPAGAIHWWSNGADGDGHVAVGMTPGAGTLAMASNAVTAAGTAWGTDSGVISLARYGQQKPAMHYVGWTLDYVGAKVKVAPAPYVVKAGDTLTSIAKAHGTTWQHLAQLNGLTDPDTLTPGQHLRLA